MLMNSRQSISKSKRSFHRDRFFYLPTVLALNDPFLRRLYSIVAFHLDDHPYPSTEKEFNRRTYQIQRNIQDLNLSPEQHQFLQRLMIETGVTLVAFFFYVNSSIFFNSMSIFGMVLISLHSIVIIYIKFGLNYHPLNHVFHLIIIKFL